MVLGSLSLSVFAEVESARFRRPAPQGGTAAATF
jgi:hypothetical protein